ncbi:Rho termination factor, N-terminal domain [Mariprofundus aestuarium]|uniref:Rho termination factor, N-terminal domain n=1 Tax=Mariprofundus aestuarium TaxID=1921086 RepID=A0A2K8KYE3_MARES|nr:hypothetical protein [Mariprofundus aestuarium]ATX80005.1 Rho termination factor, N-terminal domain [Mariprofundus aestuarium]
MSAKKTITKKDLLEKAAEIGLKGGAKLRKPELIHAIQIAEGNTDCFTRISNCAVTPCLYRSECQA